MKQGCFDPVCLWVNGGWSLPRGGFKIRPHSEADFSASICREPGIFQVPGILQAA